MNDIDALYTELKPDIFTIADQLFDLSQTFLRKQGNFLPHAAVLTEQGEVRLVGEAPETADGRTTSTDVLPLLHNGLREMAKATPMRAIGVAENVTVTLEGKQPAKAIKVLFVHHRGLTVALYLPFEKRLFRGYVLGTVFSLKAAAEVNAWARNGA
jgi:hypothetical protein